MRVLLRLGDVELPQAVRGDHLGERLARRSARRRRPGSRGRPGSGSSSSGRTRRRAAARMSCRARSGRKLKKIAASSRPKARGRRGSTGSMNSSVTPARVARLDGRHGVRRRRPSPRPDRGQRAVGALPALVAVHRVVAADDGRDRRPRPTSSRRSRGRGVRRHVAAVRERVDDRPLRRARGAGRARAAPAGGRCGSGRRRRRRARAGGRRPPRSRARANAPTSASFSKNAPRRDRAVHALQILVDDPARSRSSGDRPPSCPSGRSGRPTASPEASSVVWGYRAQSSSKTGRLGELDGVPGAGGREPPAVEDDERYERDAHRAAASGRSRRERLDVERGAADERAVHVRLRRGARRRSRA